MVSGYIHVPAGLLEDKGPQYPVYGGLKGAHNNNNRHDVLTVSFIWLDVNYTFSLSSVGYVVGGRGAGGGAERAFCVEFHHTSGDKR